jgi:hypothetical protein
MPLYDTYLIKKVAVLKVVEADDPQHAEEIAYELLGSETFEDPSDPEWDRYVYVSGEVVAQT